MIKAALALIRRASLPAAAVVFGIGALSAVAFFVVTVLAGPVGLAAGLYVASVTGCTVGPVLAVVHFILNGWGARANRSGPTEPPHQPAAEHRHA